MIFYISQFILVSFFAYIHSYHKNERFSVIAKWICLLLLFIPSALRYNIGTDYVNYKSIFNVIQKLDKTEMKLFGIPQQTDNSTKTSISVCNCNSKCLNNFPVYKNKRKIFYHNYFILMSLLSKFI